MTRKRDRRIPAWEVEVANDNKPPALGPRRGDRAPPPSEDENEPAPSGRRSALTLIAVIAGVALLYWLVTLFIDWNRLQTCMSYGGRNCTPKIEMQNQ